MVISIKKGVIICTVASLILVIIGLAFLLVAPFGEWSWYIAIPFLFGAVIPWAWYIFGSWFEEIFKDDKARMCIKCGRKIPFDAYICPYCGHEY